MKVYWIKKVVFEQDNANWVDIPPSVVKSETKQNIVLWK